MTKALKYIICALAFVVVLASCTKDTELIEQAREEFNTKAMHVSPDMVSDEVQPASTASTGNGSTRNGEGDTTTDDGTGITDDDDDEDDDDGSSVKASTK